MVGDSVSLRAVDSFNQMFPHGYIDAATNGSSPPASTLTNRLWTKGSQVALASSHSARTELFSSENVDELMNLAGTNRIVVFVNNRAARPLARAE